MSGRKRTGADIREKNLTASGKRRGRRPNYLKAEQLENPGGAAKKMAPPHHRLTTLDIIHGVLSAKRRKFGASLAGKADEKEVARQMKRLQRIRELMTHIEGVDRLD